MLRIFKRRSPAHRAERPKYGYKFDPRPELCAPCVDLYGIEAVRASLYPQISTQDRVIAALSGYTPEEWDALPALVKQDRRETVAWELRAAS